MGLQKIKQLLKSKGNNQQNEKITAVFCMGFVDSI